MVICQICRKKFEENPNYPLKRYCSPKCAKKARIIWRKEYMQIYWFKNRESIKRQKAYYKQIRAKVLIHYSGFPPKCQKCGIEDISRLIIVGNKERHGKGLYLWLIKNDFPEGYKVLCRKCNK